MIPIRVSVKSNGGCIIESTLEAHPDADGVEVEEDGLWSEGKALGWQH